MKLSKLASVAAFAASAIVCIDRASAADLPVKAPAAIAPTFSWTGFYQGLNGGYGWENNNDVSLTGDVSNGAGNFIVSNLITGVQTFGVPVQAFKAGFNQSGGNAGGQAGYNWQFDRRWLIGVEADIQYSDIKGGVSFGHPALGIATFNGNAFNTLQWYGTARARIGFIPIERLLVYATGGLAYGETRANASMSNVSASGISFGGASPTTISCPGLTICMAGSDSKISVGWTAGFGEEYAVLPNLTLKAEYLHVDLGNQSFLLAPTVVPIGTASITAQFKNAYDIVRAGFNYKF